MILSKPLDTISYLLDVRSRGDIEAALTCYEPNATVVTEPGKLATGKDAIRAFIQATISLPIIFGDREIVEAKDIALHVSQWALRPTDGPEIAGRTTDVLRRQPDGNWLLAIDNPWGRSLLERRTAS